MAEPVDAPDLVEVDDGQVDAKQPVRLLRTATVAGAAVVVILAALAGWVGYQNHQEQKAAAQRDMFLEVARQGAVNLTTIDWQHADADMQRVLDSSTGAFCDDFAQRSKPFVEVVKNAKSASVGTVTDAGVESVTGDEAQVILAMSVKTSMAGQPDSAPRSWRMRLTVRNDGDQAKVSNVVFVP